MARHFIPEPLAALPWRVLLALMLLVAFAAAVLYSAAGGAMYPYAAPHVMRFVLFLLMAVAISYAPPELVRWAAYPLYGALIVFANPSLAAVCALDCSRIRRAAGPT